ncbi:IPT/TIG-domain family protein, putative [Candida dubliniensis CD36]|uniref:IPT/TIG-domain family protein, putative n=1 Tax=Candida dubliniensis (strain CD36 / ATCC MYA-646 / CBS 7987 / NCPF 3949 / NRRL Y-17841) TaxID=573826 RepID=B9WCU0_CANDC|nr:IPT/TIG-domain family protein, putative [Candida dubliniensis CD36]CAX44214.1 IPT/TIG-domain family protein, putative [Candida dubliniensis CD36]
MTDPLTFLDEFNEFFYFPEENETFAPKEIGKLKFGSKVNAAPKSIEVPTSYLDFSPETMNSLPYGLSISGLPSFSRVETQIKMNLTLSAPFPNHYVHISPDLISKKKLCLEEPYSSLDDNIKKHVLELDAYILTQSNKSCTVCSRCIKREQKRASRSKAGEEKSAVWDCGLEKKAIIINNKEIVSFQSGVLGLSVRIICYCRHHKESEGFKLLVVLKNHLGQVVAKQISSPIMIMDRKKNLKDSAPSSSANLVELDKKKLSISDSDNEKLMTNQFVQLSPNSLDESASEALATTDYETRGVKRKKLSVDDSFNTTSNPMYNGFSGYSPMSNSDTNTSAISQSFSGPTVSKPSSAQFSIGFSPISQPQFPSQFQSQSQLLQQQQSQSQSQQQQILPSIQKIIPAQGSIKGGIEVTILGFNFRPGLSIKFGPNQALATHCWSETTIVTYLPPAAQPGQVLVSFENQDNDIVGGPQQQQVFTYTDDTDRQLIELALQIVGLKMNGKLEDAKNIAKRIVGTDNNNNNNNNNNNGNSSSNTSSSSPVNDTTAAVSTVTPTNSNTSSNFENDEKSMAKLNKLVEFFESRTNNQDDLEKWSSMKTSEIFGDQEEEYFADSEVVPSYKSIFPNGGNANHAKISTEPEPAPEADAGATSDSSEDMVVTYINHPRKSVENDKMLLFFWIPTLIAMLTIFFMVYVMGYQLNNNFIVEKVLSYTSLLS